VVGARGEKLYRKDPLSESKFDLEVRMGTGRSEGEYDAVRLSRKHECSSDYFVHY
jgi:hypothetical protein